MQNADSLYRTLFERIDEAFCIIEVIFDGTKAVDYRFVDVNPAFERHTGIPAAPGRRMREIAAEHEEHWFEIYGAIALTGQAKRFQAPARFLRDRWYDVHAFPIGASEQRRVAILFNDITQRQRDAAALRESEERFQQFANASSQALWVRDAASLQMEYVSPAIEKIYGVEPDAFLGEVRRWAALILPEDRDAALEHLERARRGETVVHEFRIQRPSDMAFRWIRNTEFPFRDETGRVHRIGGIAEDVTVTKLAIQHQGVLLAELQHRVRNVMAIIRSIAVRTGESATSVKDYAALMSGRLMTLARVQTLLTRAPNVGVNVKMLVQEEIGAQAEHAGQYTITGPEVALPPKAAEVLTLALHELSTNAVKYGALSSSGGHIDVTWTVTKKRGIPWFSFRWIERGVLTPLENGPRRVGFGSELIEGRIPYELGGTGRVRIEPGGAHCHLEFPLADSASLLETGAPQRTIVFGGALDMTGHADLRGERILVVEDDYYLASDTARALRGAGAQVLGPSPVEEVARSAVEHSAPTGAVIDINLGSGPSFKIAERLKQRGIPFIFMTGYDALVIPPEFANVPRLQKPVDLKRIIDTLARHMASPRQKAAGA